MKKIHWTLCLWLGLFAGNALHAGTLKPSEEQTPEARRDSILQLITGATTPERTLSITSLGAKGDGVKDCKPAFDKAMARAKKNGGVHLIVPAGTYLINGPIHLVSNVCLELQEGAELKFSSDPKYYLPIVETSWEGTFLQNYSPFIYARQAENISIIGQGTINGNADETFATWRAQQKPGQQRSRDMNHQQVARSERNFGEGSYLRPHLIQFYDCKKVTLEGVFITRSPFWCIHLLRSENIICRGLRYDAKLVNNDGIDPEHSRNILIEEITFNNGDDNVAIKAGRDHDGRAEAAPSAGIIIRNCSFKGLHGVVLGSEMSAGIEDVFIEDCTTAGYCKRGIYVKTNPDRGGFIRRIYVNRCRFEEVEDLFYITSKYAGEGLDNHFFTKVYDIHVKDLFAKTVRQNAIVLQGTAAEPLHDISFDNVQVEQVRVGLSMSDAIEVKMTNCNLGGTVDVPTQVTEKDGLFSKDK